MGVQVGCVLGKSGENIGQIRKVPCSPPAHTGLQDCDVLGAYERPILVFQMLRGRQSLLGEAVAE